MATAHGRARARMPALSVCCIVLLASAGVLRGFQQSSRRTMSSAEHKQALVELNRRGEHPSLLSKSALLRGFSAEQLDQALDSGNRFLQAAAIAEMANRRDASSRAKILRIFDAGIPAEGARPLDSRAALSPHGVRFLAAMRYVAATERLNGAAKILARPEPWQMPAESASALRAAGPGWVDAALKQAYDPIRREAVGVMIAHGATADNAAEVVAALKSGEPSLWQGALTACERLNLPACWTALGEDRLSSRSPVDRLRATMAAFRNGRATQAGLFESARRVAETACGLPPGAELAASLIALQEFEGLAHWAAVAVPEEITSRIRQAREGRARPMPPGGRQL